MQSNCEVEQRNRNVKQKSEFEIGKNAKILLPALQI